MTMLSIRYSMTFWRVSLLLICYSRFVVTIQLGRINNARFDPIDPSAQITTSFNVPSLNSCICQCSSNANCSLATYHGRNQSCSLFSAKRSQGNLHLVPTSELSSVVIFNDISSTVITTTHATTSISDTTLGDSCAPPATPLLQYTVLPTSYEKQIYNYTAPSTRMAMLEFGFMAKNPSKTWHLDDVSVIDTSTLNTEQLANGGFENTNSTGWVVTCSSNNCAGSGGAVVQTTCHTGSFCYQGACRGNYDFLRQSFPVIVNHVYTLSFWLYTDGHSAQAAYVSIS